MRAVIYILTLLTGMLAVGCCRPGGEGRDYVRITNLCLQNGKRGEKYGQWRAEVFPYNYNTIGYYMKDTLVTDSITGITKSLYFSCDGYWYYTMLDKIFMQRNDSSCFCWNADYNPKGNCLHPGSNFKKENFKYWTEDNGKVLVLQACGYPSQNDTVPRLFQMRFKANLYMKKKPCRCYNIGTLLLYPLNNEAKRFAQTITSDTSASRLEFVLSSDDCLE